jgi:hypothetical protein
MEMAENGRFQGFRLGFRDLGFRLIFDFREMATDRIFITQKRNIDCPCCGANKRSHGMG